MKQEKLTRFIKSEDAPKKWYVIDASDKVLGRLAAKIAMIVRGKNKALFTPNTDTGDFVVVVNAEKVMLTGKRSSMKTYYHYSGYPGGLKSQNINELLEKHPERVIEMAVRGMLPKTKLGDRLIHKLKVYSGSQHPHTAQKPEALSL